MTPFLELWWRITFGALLAREETREVDLFLDLKS